MEIISLYLSCGATILSIISLIFAILSFSSSLKIAKQALNDKYFEVLKPSISSLRMVLLDLKYCGKTDISRQQIDREASEGILLAINYSFVHNRKNLKKEFNAKIEHSWADEFCELTEKIETFIDSTKKLGFCEKKDAEALLISVNEITKKLFNILL